MFVRKIKAQEDAHCRKKNPSGRIQRAFEVMNRLILNFLKIQTAGSRFPTTAKAFYHYFSLSQKLFDENPVSLKVFKKCLWF